MRTLSITSGDTSSSWTSLSEKFRYLVQFDPSGAYEFVILDSQRTNNAC